MLHFNYQFVVPINVVIIMSINLPMFWIITHCRSIITCWALYIETNGCMHYWEGHFCDICSNWHNMKPIRAKAPWRAMKVHKPPNWHEWVKSPCASGPHRSSKECVKLLAGVETTAIKKLQPSK